MKSGPSDADSDLFGLDWDDDPIKTINSVTEQNDRSRGGKELLAFARLTLYFQVSVYRVSTGGDLQVAERSWFHWSQTGHPSSTIGSGGFESGQVLEAT